MSLVLGSHNLLYFIIIKFHKYGKNTILFNISHFYACFIPLYWLRAYSPPPIPQSPAPTSTTSPRHPPTPSASCSRSPSLAMLRWSALPAAKHAHCFNADWNFKGAFRTAFLMVLSPVPQQHQNRENCNLKNLATRSLYITFFSERWIELPLYSSPLPRFGFRLTSLSRGSLRS